MKETGIEWIGKIPDSWELNKIGQLFNLRNEKVSDKVYAPLSVSKSGVVPQMESVAKSDASDDRKLVIAGDFAINSRSDRKMSCGVSPLDGSVSLINTILYPKNESVIFNNYMNYLLKNYGFAEEFYRWGHGIVADLWTTKWQEMKSIMLPLPDIDTQKKIYEFLNKKSAEIDSLIEIENQQIEKLKEYKQAVISEAVTKGLNPNVPMKDSGIEWIGEMPESWSRVKAINLFEEIGSGTTPKGDNYYADGTIDWIQSGDINGGVLTSCSTKVNDFALKDFSALKVYQSPFLIMAMYGGSVGHLSISYIDGCCNQACCVMRNPNCNFDFAYYSLQAVKNYLLKSAIGGGQPNISQTIIKSLWFCEPSIDEQKDIAAYLNKKCFEIDELISLKQKKINDLNEYKKSLIYEYVTGKRRVS